MTKRWTFFVLLPGVLMLGGCGGSSETDENGAVAVQAEAAPESAPEPTTPLEYADATSACLTEVCQLLAGVADRESGEAAIPKLRELGERLKKLVQQGEAAKANATPEQIAQVTPKHFQQVENRLVQLSGAAERLRRIPGMPPELLHAIGVSPAKTADGSKPPPEAAGKISPEVVEKLSPELAGKLSPQLLAMISPEVLDKIPPELVEYAKVANEELAALKKRKRKSGKRPMPPKALEIPASLTDPNHKDYLKDNLKHMLDGGSLRDHAMKQLIGVDPNDVPSQELRAEIARAFELVATDESVRSHARASATDGLVIWSGQHSVPLLIEFLKSNDVGLRRASYRGLARLQDTRAIEPVTERFMKGDLLDAANCLESFGWKAEDALLKRLGKGSVPTIRATVVLLGKVGTKKSLSPLRKLRAERFFGAIRKDQERAVQAVSQR